MRYELNAGRIATWALEAHVVDQCNLRCVQCCSLSPHLPARMTTPEQLAKDLGAAASVLAPQTFKLTGGEPFLHPALTELLDVARESGIAKQYSATTNGFLAANAPDAVFERLDRLTLSIYTSVPLPLATVDRLRARCREHDVILNEKAFDSFQRITPDEAADPLASFASCWMKEKCHLLHEGRFFTCTRPPHLDAYLRTTELSVSDGVPLHERDLLATLLRYLERDEPIASCRKCLGNRGEWAAHAQLA